MNRIFSANPASSHTRNPQSEQQIFTLSPLQKKLFPLFSISEYSAFFYKNIIILIRFCCALAAFIGLCVTAKLLLQSGETGNMPAVFIKNTAFLSAALGAAAAFTAIFWRQRRHCRILQREKTMLAALLAEPEQHREKHMIKSAAKEEYSAADQKSLPIAEDSANAVCRSSLAAALHTIKEPLWIRDKNGKLLFANKACETLFAAQAENRQPISPEQNGNAADFPDMEMLFSPALRQALQEARQQKQNFSGKGNIILRGNRHIFSCQSVYHEQEGIFIITAEDKTQNIHLAEEIQRIQEGYAEVFDCLATSVAIFSPTQNLEFYNSAFAALWPLETTFLEEKPSHAALLDRLREKGILNERPDWRQWKNELLSAYHALNPQHYIWNLPDSRTLRVIANPHPQGGVTWLFDDLTEKLALQSRYNSLIQMQGETLDNLSEGVAVFGADGKLRLANPSFAKLWHLPADLAIEGTHIEKIKNFFLQNRSRSNKAEHEQSAETLWRNIALFITGLADARDFMQGRTEIAETKLHERIHDGSGGKSDKGVNSRSPRIFDHMLVPLPQGQTMVTFVDVTDSVHIARALHERNAALEEADRLSNDFVRHVSYDLRTPLTTIMGFTDLLLSPVFGSLNPRQSEYLRDIAAQSALLFNLVNDILDLATVDAGIMELNIRSVAIDKSMSEAAERLKSSMAEKNIAFTLHIAEGLTQFEADEARVRQIFINLLSNAVHAAPQNSAIRFSAEKYHGSLAFIVEDEGAGIPKDRQKNIFKRFTSHPYEDGHKTGIGLGLSIVKSFVELHQGRILAENGAECGAKFICLFPFQNNAVKQIKEKTINAAESTAGTTETDKISAEPTGENPKSDPEKENIVIAAKPNENKNHENAIRAEE